jgi:hypothetical protein
MVSPYINLVLHQPNKGSFRSRYSKKKTLVSNVGRKTSELRLRALSAALRVVYPSW